MIGLNYDPTGVRGRQDTPMGQKEIILFQKYFRDVNQYCCFRNANN